MIKVDIVNEVSRVADVTKVKAELAVDAVFEAMRRVNQNPRHGPEDYVPLGAGG